MDKTLAYALLVSLLIHCAILWPLRYFVEPPKRADEKKPVVVDYKIIREIPRASAAKPALPRPAETPKVEIKKEVVAKPAAGAPESVTKAPEPKTLTSQELAKRQAELRTTRDYINYYQLLREKVRRRLKEHYKPYHKEGEAALRFSLGSDGSLISCDIDNNRSTSDPSLRSIALQSVREASPFPEFPKALTVPNMSFELEISFRKDN